MKIKKSEGEAGESSGTAIEEHYLALHVNVLQQLQQGADMVRLLQSQLDSTQVAGATKLVEVENKLLSVERERNETMRELQEKKDQVELYNTLLSNLAQEKRTAEARAEGDLTAMRKEFQNVRKSHVSDLENAKRAFETVRQFLEARAEADLTAMRKELQNVRKSHVSDLENAKRAFETARQFLEARAEGDLTAMRKELQNVRKSHVSDWKMQSVLLRQSGKF
ncbi:unnamed protein product [Calypogeia fissa]